MARFSNDIDYYAVLGIKPTATLDEIKAEYRYLSHQKHPDKFPPNLKERAEMDFKRVNEAYQVLSNPSLRKEYDEERMGGGDRPSEEENARSQKNYKHEKSPPPHKESSESKQSEKHQPKEKPSSKEGNKPWDYDKMAKEEPYKSWRAQGPEAYEKGMRGKRTFFSTLCQLFFYVLGFICLFAIFFSIPEILKYISEEKYSALIGGLTWTIILILGIVGCYRKIKFYGGN